MLNQAGLLRVCSIPARTCDKEVTCGTWTFGYRSHIGHSADLLPCEEHKRKDTAERLSR